MADNKTGTLYIVATPIGNLEDLSLRAARMLAEVDFIAAEDTRVTVKLLNHLNIKKPMLSYFEHNRIERGEIILNRILGGESCALCSDAGIPAISDPGEELVREAHMQGIRVVPIPGANAALSALCASGQSTARFVFEGFLPQNKRTRSKHLEALKKEKRTIILYEAPHKLPATLKDLVSALGSGRKLSICRELTKIHEEIFISTAGEACEKYSVEKPRGEFVLIIDGYSADADENPYTLRQAGEIAAELMEKENMGASAAAKAAAAETGFGKSDIYRLIVNNK